MNPAWMVPKDLAPGDQKSLERDWSGFEMHVVRDGSDAWFRPAYDALWNEFGASGEVELEDVILRRLERGDRWQADGYRLCYRLCVLHHAGKWAVIHDETAMVADSLPGAMVHISHQLVAPEWRRTGLAGWMRALPVDHGRRFLAACGRCPSEPMLLIAEMEHPNPADPATLARLAASEKAGFKMIDPATVHYHQPDFLGAADGAPLPLSLVIRNVGREEEASLPESMVRQIIDGIYAMFGTDFPGKSIAAARAASLMVATPSGEVRLLPPISRPAEFPNA